MIVLTNTLSRTEHTLIQRAAEVTAPVVTYWAPDDSRASYYVTRGTGILLRYRGRYFAVTNTHVLEAYWCLKRNKVRVAVQVGAADGVPGVEHHAGYLLAPRPRRAEELSVVSEYGHQDIGIIHLTPKGTTAIKKARRFLTKKRLDPTPLRPGEVVLYKGYPSKSAELHPSIRAINFALWAEFRMVDQVGKNIIILQSPPKATVRQRDYNEDGMDLHGISGSGLFDVTGRLRGIVWGGHSGIKGPIWAVPTATLLEMIDEYMQRTSA